LSRAKARQAMNEFVRTTETQVLRPVAPRAAALRKISDIVKAG